MKKIMFLVLLSCILLVGTTSCTAQEKANTKFEIGEIVYIKARIDSIIYEDDGLWYRIYACDKSGSWSSMRVKEKAIYKMGSVK